MYNVDYGLTVCPWCNRKVPFDPTKGKMLRHRYDDSLRYPRCWGSGKTAINISCQR
jgi:hypothetical protein